MDDLTHALTGMVIARAVLGRDPPKIAVRAVWVSALFPDIDCLLQFLGSETFIFYHRGITHSLFGLPVFALLLGGLFYCFGPSNRQGREKLYSARLSSALFPPLLTSPRGGEELCSLPQRVRAGVRAGKAQNHAPQSIDAPESESLAQKAWGVSTGKRFWYLSFLCALGLLSHILLDLITSYGTLILAPFSDRRYFLDYVFIIDPIFTAIVAFPLLVGWWRRRQAEGLHRAFLLVLLTYIGFCGLHHQIALNRVQKAAPGLSPEVRRVDVLPQPLAPFQWTGLVETPGGSYQAWFSVYSDEPLRFRAFPNGKANPYIRIADKLELIKLYRWFARYPVIRYQEMGNRHVVEYFDLRFNTLLLGLGLRRSFVMEVILDGRGRVLSQGFKRSHG